MISLKIYLRIRKIKFHYLFKRKYRTAINRLTEFADLKRLRTLKQLEEREALLNDIITTMRITLDIDVIKKTFVTKIGEVFGSDANIFYLIEPNSDLFHPVDESSFYTSSPEILSPLGLNIEDYGWGNLFRTQTNELIYSNVKDFLNDYNLRGTKGEEFINLYKIKSFLILPVTFADQFFGILGINYIKKHKHITYDDISLAKTLANQAGIALKQAELYLTNQEQVKKSNVLRKITEAMRSTLDFNEFKVIFLTEIGKYLNPDRCVLSLYNKKEECFYPIDEHSEYLATPDTLSLMGLIDTDEIAFLANHYKREKKEFIVPDVDVFIKENNFQNTLLEKTIKETWKIKAGIGIPILYAGEILGILYINYLKEKRYFKQEEIQFIRDIVNQAGIGLHQIQLYQEQKLIAEREALLRKITQTMRGSFNLNETTKKIVTEVGKIVNADRCFIIKYDHNNKTFFSVNEHSEYLADNTVKSVTGIISKPEETKYFYEIGNKQLELIIKDIDDYIDIDDKDQLYAYNYLKDLNVKTNIGITMVHSNKLIGRLVIHYKEKVTFLEEDLEFIKTLASQAASAIYESKIFNEFKKTASKEKLLRTVSEILKSDRDLEEKIFLLNSEISNNFDISHILLVEFNRLMTAPINIREYRSNVLINPFDKMVYCEKTRTYWHNTCLNLSKPICFNNIGYLTELPDYFRNHYNLIGVKSIAAIPFKLGNDRNICMFLYSYECNKFFNIDDLVIIEDIISQISVFLKEKAIYSQKVFLSNISHEIKTPLTLISGFAELLIDKKTRESDRSDEFLEAIVDNVKRVNNIIDNLLYISKIEEDTERGRIQLEVFPLNDIIDNVIYMCSDSLSTKNLKILFEFDNIYYSEVNAVLIEQAILNLVNNSIKYCNINSTITICLSENNEFNIIAIKDESQGIENEHLKNIFERFYRTDKSRSPDTGGTGLGLFIVKLIAEAHYGKIRAESEVESGSTFYLYLPKYNNILEFNSNLN